MSTNGQSLTPFSAPLSPHPIPDNKLSNRDVQKLKKRQQHFKGGSPGLVVLGGGSCSEGCGFESRRYILNGQDNGQDNFSY